MLDFSNNVNFLGPPKIVGEILNKDHELYSRYPDYQHKDARNAVATQFLVDPASVAIGIGSTELFSIIPRLVSSDSIGIAPSFWEYQYFFKKIHPNNKYERIILEEDSNFSISMPEFFRRLTLTSAKLCYIANPNNPTATQFKREELIYLIENFPDIIFVVDETYLPFTENYLQDSLFHYAQNKLNLIITSSVSKIFSLPGLRIGYCCSHPDNIKKIYDHLIPYGVTPLSLKTILHLMKQSDFLIETQKKYRENIMYFSKRLKESFNEKINIFDSKTAFMLVKFNENLLNDRVEYNLLEKGIRIRSGTEFNELGIDWMRLSIRNIHEIDFFVDSLMQILC